MERLEGCSQIEALNLRITAPSWCLWTERLKKRKTDPSWARGGSNIEGVEEFTELLFRSPFQTLLT